MNTVDGKCRRSKIDLVMMLEDEVMLAWPLPGEVPIRVVDRRPCSLNHCDGHRSQREMDAIHDAIESCYAPLRD